MILKVFFNLTDSMNYFKMVWQVIQDPNLYLVIKNNKRASVKFHMDTNVMTLQVIIMEKFSFKPFYPKATLNFSEDTTAAKHAIVVFCLTE